MKPRTHCRHGHSRAEHAYTDSRGVVVCRECRRGRAQRDYLTSHAGHRVTRMKHEREGANG